MASIGSGITLLNNLTQLCASIAPAGRDSVTEATALVKLFSIFNCAGRLVSGLVSQIYLKRGVARGWFMLLASLVMSLACFITAFAPLEVIYRPVVFAGFAFGSFWCLIPTITSEIFGTRYFATIYNTISVGPVIGSVVLSSLMAGSLYDLHSRAFPTGEFGSDGQPILVERCEGKQCFQATYIICSMIAFAGACASHFGPPHRQALRDAAPGPGRVRVVITRPRYPLSPPPPLRPTHRSALHLHSR